MGLKHSGKTTFASMYSERAGIDFADADYLVMKLIKPLSVREYYRKNGAKAFQALELDAVDDFLLSEDKPYVLSLGGGASDNEELMKRISPEGKRIYLYREKSDMLPRILKDGIPPFLDEDDVEGSFSRLFERRDRIYRENADLVIDLGPYRDIEETYKVLCSRLEEVVR